MKRLLVLSLAVVLSVAVHATQRDIAAPKKPQAQPHECATCVGADPCNACKTCNYCKHCAKEGGTCGVNKPR